MGWLWGSSDNTSNGNTNDPYSKLDPALREFLEKESPLKYKDTKPKPTQAPDTDYRAQVGLDKPGLTQEKQNAEPRQNQPDVPPESLYQDGRYAHLWKTYRPESEIQSASKSDQDRMRDVFDAYSERKAAIGRAAIENCVMEQMAEKECFMHGSWSKRMTMCRDENRAFLRCYEMQSRFMKALGYLSQPRGADEEERIQMHADKLYSQMLEREAAAEAPENAGAKREARDSGGRAAGRGIPAGGAGILAGGAGFRRRAREVREAVHRREVRESSGRAAGRGIPAGGAGIPTGGAGFRLEASRSTGGPPARGVGPPAREAGIDPNRLGM